MLKQRVAISMIELVVVLSIIGILSSLLLVAVQAARESSRNLSCSNNLRQIALASQTHLTTHGHFPAVGWGINWIALRDRGNGLKQPGGWMYNLLPLLEANSTHALAATEQESVVGLDVARLENFNRLIHSTFVCPAKMAPNNDRRYTGASWQGDVLGGYPSSFAINAGSNTIGGELRGPTNLDFSDFPALWPATAKPANGVARPGQLIVPKHVSDGMSTTIFAGEKYVVRSRKNYIGDTLSPWFGFSLSSIRYVALSPFRDGDPHGDPQSFGSPHPSHFNVAMCDGSIQTLSFEITQKVFTDLGVRDDGNPISAGDY
jgi:prepilin-type processing-associated H-X9-DG protein